MLGTYLLLQSCDPGSEAYTGRVSVSDKRYVCVRASDPARYNEGLLQV